MNIRILTFALMIFATIFKVNAQRKGVVVDKRDAKVYKTVEIGNQLWMSENLAFKASSGCWAYNKDPRNVGKYGYLYNYATAIKACPLGWHTANDADWKNLAKQLGGKKNAAAKMKATSDWDNNSINNNNSGFNAIPAGSYTKSDSKFQSMGKLAAMWTATMSEDDLGMTVWSFLLGNTGDDLANDHIVFNENDGLSVRCVKDGFLNREEELPTFPKGVRVKLIEDASPFSLLYATMEEQYGKPTIGTVQEDLVPLGDGWYSGKIDMREGGSRNFKKAKFELVK